MTRDYGDNADIIVELGVESRVSERPADRAALAELATGIEALTTEFLKGLQERQR